MFAEQQKEVMLIKWRRYHYYTQAQTICLVTLGSVSRFTGLFYKMQPLYLSKTLMEYCRVYKKIPAEITILINTD